MDEGGHISTSHGETSSQPNYQADHSLVRSESSEEFVEESDREIKVLAKEVFSLIKEDTRRLREQELIQQRRHEHAELQQLRRALWKKNEHELQQLRLEMWKKEEQQAQSQRLDQVSRRDEATQYEPQPTADDIAEAGPSREAEPVVILVPSPKKKKKRMSFICIPRKRRRHSSSPSRKRPRKGPAGSPSGKRKKKH